MKCPYAVLKGFIGKRVYCSIVGKIVDHKRMGCLTDKYKQCPYYLKTVMDKIKEEKEENREEVIAPEDHEVAEEKDVLEKMVNESVRKARSYADPRRGIYPDSCYDCLYFSPTTRLCLYLRIKVDDPDNPPCKRSEKG